MSLVALLDERGRGVPRIYHKRALLPFGEHRPGLGLIPGVERWRTTGRFFSGARRQRDEVMALTSQDCEGSAALLAPSVCFEVLEPGHFNTAVRAGAQVLINLADDGWFDANAEPIAHLNGSRLRAIATGRWLVRATGSGISAIVADDGRIIDSIPIQHRGIAQADVPLRSEMTLYTRLGD